MAADSAARQLKPYTEAELSPKQQDPTKKLGRQYQDPTKETQEQFTEANVESEKQETIGSRVLLKLARNHLKFSRKQAANNQQI